MIKSWIKTKDEKKEEDHLDLEDLKNEFLAFKKLITASHELLESLSCFSLFIDGILTGFMINEKISKDYSLGHFSKADVKYDGIYQFLMQQNSRVFLDLGISYLNHEQDLGIDKLRIAKTRFRPVMFFKKYQLTYY